VHPRAQNQLLYLLLTAWQLPLFAAVDMLYLSQVTRDSLNPRNKKYIKKRGGNPLVREEEEDSAEDLSGACLLYADVC